MGSEINIAGGKMGAGERRIELETCVLVIPDGCDITRLFLSADKILREAGVIVGELPTVEPAPAERKQSKVKEVER